ncbi:hypothetical protein [Vulcanisaeta distributa]|uniref:hypothetical protein n=1 Tax=Vulcanisaeta distributa TaxID=164451 RepID=UPI000A8FEC6E|nr:hypothetical protein [Vulcanisaeta distributa]
MGSDTWVVRGGEPSMGDKLPQYIVRFVNGKYTCDCQVSAWGGESRGGLCTHIGAVIISQLYNEFTKTVYAAVVRAECLDNELLIPGNNEVMVNKAVQGSTTIYIIRTRQETTVKALLACNDEVRELLIETKPTKSWEVMKILRSKTA